MSSNSVTDFSILPTTAADSNCVRRSLYYYIRSIYIYIETKLLSVITAPLSYTTGGLKTTSIKHCKQICNWICLAAILVSKLKWWATIREMWQASPLRTTELPEDNKLKFEA